MEREMRCLHIKYEDGLDVGSVLREVAGAIVNGRIRCDGLETRENEEGGADTYLVKGCGEREIVIPELFPDERLTVDLDGRGILVFEVRRKRE